MNLNFLLQFSFSKVFLPCLLLSALPVYGQGVGNLFTTPEERQYLDSLREEFLRNNEAANFDVSEIAPPPIIIEEVLEEVAVEAPVYRLGAIMSRSNGSRSVWLNDDLLEEDRLPANFSLINSDLGLALSIRVEGTNYILKPGQSFDSGSGTIRESSQAIVQTITQSPEPQSTPTRSPTQNPILDAAASSESPQSLLLEGPIPDFLPDLNDPAVIQALQVLQEASSAQ